MVFASLCAVAWLYFKAAKADFELRERALLDQARVIGSFLTTTNNGTIELNLPSRLAEAYASPTSAYRYAVRDSTGQSLFESGAVGPLPSIADGSPELYDYDPDGEGPLHAFGAAYVSYVGRQKIIIQVEQHAHEHDRLREAVFDEFVTDGGWLEILFLFVLLGVSVLIVRTAVAPLTRISKLAETIDPAHADIRLPEAGVPNEILPLVRSMNSALDRLEQGLQRQREFSANAAHELRTPLAVLMANLDSLNGSDITTRLRADVNHMSRIVSQLLVVAKLETASIDHDEIVELNTEVADIAAGFAPLAIASSKSIELFRSDQPTRTRVSKFALRAALGNLIENALRHTPAGTSVRIRVTERPSIEVMDCGPGIPIELRSLVFERFWRSDQSVGGAGLGLAIVDRIMKSLQGSVTVDTAASGGALFTLVFPMVPEN
jgi:signal transduction histidine kinase